MEKKCWNWCYFLKNKCGISSDSVNTTTPLLWYLRANLLITSEIIKRKKILTVWNVSACQRKFLLLLLPLAVFISSAWEFQCWLRQKTVAKQTSRSSFILIHDTLFSVFLYWTTVDVGITAQWDRFGCFTVIHLRLH